MRIPRDYGSPHTFQGHHRLQFHSAAQLLGRQARERRLDVVPMHLHVAAPPPEVQRRDAHPVPDKRQLAHVAPAVVPQRAARGAGSHTEGTDADRLQPAQLVPRVPGHQRRGRGTRSRQLGHLRADQEAEDLQPGASVNNNALCFTPAGLRAACRQVTSAAAARLRASREQAVDAAAGGCVGDPTQRLRPPGGRRLSKQRGVPAAQHGARVKTSDAAKRSREDAQQ